MIIVSLYDTDGTRGANLGFKDAADFKTFEDAFKASAPTQFTHTEPMVGGATKTSVYNLANYGYYTVIK